MKKSTLALAIAAALAGFGSAAYADTTLYGSARVSVDYEDFDSSYSQLPNGSLQRIIPGSDGWDVFNNASRLGVRGEEDLGGGLSAIYQYEFGVDVTEGGTGFNSNRPKWVGLKGSSWGSLTAGTQWTPYYNALGIGDIFNSSKIYDKDIYLGDAFGLRMDNSVIYSTPNWGGFSLQAMLVMNGTGGAPGKLNNLSDGVDMWNIGASYKNGPFFVGASYMALNTNPKVFNAVGDDLDDPDQWGAAVGFNSGPFAVSLTYERGEVNARNFGVTENYFLTGQYTFGNNILRAAYGHSDPKDSSYNILVNNAPVTVVQEEADNFVLGYQYNLSKRTRLWVEYVGQDIDSKLVGDRQAVSIGTRVDF